MLPWRQIRFVFSLAFFSAWASSKVYLYLSNHDDEIHFGVDYVHVEINLDVDFIYFFEGNVFIRICLSVLKGVGGGEKKGPCTPCTGPCPRHIQTCSICTSLYRDLDIKPDTPINVYTRFCLNTAKSKFSLVSPVADWWKTINKQLNWIVYY